MADKSMGDKGALLVGDCPPASIIPRGDTPPPPLSNHHRPPPPRMDCLAGRPGRRPYDKSSRANARQCGPWHQRVLCEADGHRRDRDMVGYLGGRGALGRMRYPRRAETGTRSSFSVVGA